MNLLARREHSQFELHNKLKAKGYTEHIINGVLQELAEENLQSDGRFAENFIRARANHGFGPIRIALELRERGIPRDMINKLVDKNNDKWKKMAMEIKQKKFGDPTEYAKQARFLQYKGFTHEQIKYACCRKEV
jgi:regulatory protein